MKKIPHLNYGDTVAITSLSDGLLTQDFQINQIITNLSKLGLKTYFPPNAKRSYDELKGWNGARLRASDLKQVYMNASVKAIFSAIGGNDAYRTIPFLLNDKEFEMSVQCNPKIFSGFSDTTVIHYMFYKLGLRTFYGPSALSDFAESPGDILPYTKKHVQYLFTNASKWEIDSSLYWYNERQLFSEEELKFPRNKYKDKFGFDFISGSGIIEGRLLGGCIETMYDMLSNNNVEARDICKEYGIFPSKNTWRDKVIFIESSAAHTNPFLLKKMLETLNDNGVFREPRAILLGKPQVDSDYDICREIYRKFFMSILGNIPIVYNVNFGHSFPRCILPYDARVKINCEAKQISITEQILK